LNGVLPEETGGTRPLHDSGPRSGPLEVITPSTTGTRPLTRGRMFYEALPERALLHDDQYAIRAVIEESNMLNIYSAVSRRAMVECKQCGFARNNYGDQYCLQCGASLANLEPVYLNFVIKETLAADAVAIERQLAEMGLHHGGALLPVDTFNETILGTRRVYVVLPEPSPFSGTHLPNQPEMTDVVNWGVQLADSLAYLHKNNVAFGAANLDHMSISGKAVRWFNFSSARFQTPGTRNKKSYSDDVQSLAASLFVLLTGKVYSPEVEVDSPLLSEAFQQVFAGQISTASQFADQLRDVIAEIRRPASYDVRVGRLSDVGQVRQINEDSLMTMELGRVHRSISDPLGIYVVADGMGGHMAGDIASGLAVQTIARLAHETLMPASLDTDGRLPDIESWLRDTIEQANITVHEQRRLAGTNMGTTLVMVVVTQGQAYIAHVGDSRAYLINAAGCQVLTIDHSLVQRLVDTKQLTLEEARNHPQKHVIYKNLGDRPSVAPDITRVELQPGDRLLLCSDGLWDYIDEKLLYQIVTQAPSPQDACRQLIAAANANGGPDNITAIIVQMESLG
jgi:serine/threonine protein phosphatase PrpC